MEIFPITMSYLFYFARDGVSGKKLHQDWQMAGSYSQRDMSMHSAAWPACMTHGRSHAISLQRCPHVSTQLLARLLPRADDHQNQKKWTARHTHIALSFWSVWTPEACWSRQLCTSSPSACFKNKPKMSADFLVRACSLMSMCQHMYACALLWLDRSLCWSHAAAFRCRPVMWPLAGAHMTALWYSRTVHASHAAPYSTVVTLSSIMVLRPSLPLSFPDGEHGMAPFSLSPLQVDFLWCPREVRCSSMRLSRFLFGDDPPSVPEPTAEE